MCRGWVGPYGDAVASWSSTGLESSEDWIVNPGRIDLLTDYVGWVPVPTHGPSGSCMAYCWPTYSIQFTDK